MSEIAVEIINDMQVQVKPTFYQSFGGINFMEDSLDHMAFEELITLK